MSFICFAAVSMIPRKMLNSNLILGIFDLFPLFIHSLFMQHLLCGRNPSRPWKHRCDQWIKSIGKFWREIREEWKCISKKLDTALPQRITESSLKNFPKKILFVFHPEISSLLFAFWQITLSKERKFPFLLCFLKAAFKKPGTDVEYYQSLF